MRSTGRRKTSRRQALACGGRRPCGHVRQRSGGGPWYGRAPMVSEESRKVLHRLREELARPPGARPRSRGARRAAERVAAEAVYLSCASAGTRRPRWPSASASRARRSSSGSSAASSTPSSRPAGTTASRRARSRRGGTASAPTSASSRRAARRPADGALDAQDLLQRRRARPRAARRSARACPPRAGSRSPGGGALAPARVSEWRSDQPKTSTATAIEPSATTPSAAGPLQPGLAHRHVAERGRRQHRRDQVRAAAVVLLGRVGRLAVLLVGGDRLVLDAVVGRPGRRRAARAAPGATLSSATAASRPDACARPAAGAARVPASDARRPSRRACARPASAAWPPAARA